MFEQNTVVQDSISHDYPQNAPITEIHPANHSSNFSPQSSEQAPYSTTTNQPSPNQNTNPPPASGTADKAKATVKEFGINLDKPKHPDFAVLSVRIKTYENKWSEDLRQTPKELSLAGFFYGGKTFCVTLHLYDYTSIQHTVMI